MNEVNKNTGNNTAPSTVRDNAHEASEAAAAMAASIDAIKALPALGDRIVAAEKLAKANPQNGLLLAYLAQLQGENRAAAFLHDKRNVLPGGGNTTPPATPTAAVPEKAPAKAAGEAKPQGGTPTTLNPHTAPVKPTKAETGKGAKPAPAKGDGKGKGAKGKPEKAAATPTVSAVKAKKLTPREAALANADFVCGYDFSLWPRGEGEPKPPGVVEIMATRALGLFKVLSLNELTFACYLTSWAQSCNVYDWGRCTGAVLGGNGDHKMNVVNQKAVPSGLVRRLADKVVPYIHAPNQRGRVAYAVEPTREGLKRIASSFEGLKLKVPQRWLEKPPAVAKGAKGKPEKVPAPVATSA